MHRNINHGYVPDNNLHDVLFEHQNRRFDCHFKPIVVCEEFVLRESANIDLTRPH